MIRKESYKNEKYYEKNRHDDVYEFVEFILKLIEK